MNFRFQQQKLLGVGGGLAVCEAVCDLEVVYAIYSPGLSYRNELWTFFQRTLAKEKLDKSDLATGTWFSATEIITNSSINSWASKRVTGKGEHFLCAVEIQWSLLTWLFCALLSKKYQLDVLYLVIGHCSYSDCESCSENMKTGFFCVYGCWTFGSLLQLSHIV